MFEPLLGILEFGNVFVEAPPVVFELVLGVFPVRDIEGDGVGDEGAIHPPPGSGNRVHPAPPASRMVIAELVRVRLQVGEGPHHVGMERLHVVGMDTVGDDRRIPFHFGRVEPGNVPRAVIYERKRDFAVRVQRPLKHQAGNIVCDVAELGLGLGGRVPVVFRRAVRTCRTFRGFSLRLYRAVPALTVCAVIPGMGHERLGSGIIFRVFREPDCCGAPCPNIVKDRLSFRFFGVSVARFLNQFAGLGGAGVEHRGGPSKFDILDLAGIGAVEVE